MPNIIERIFSSLRRSSPPQTKPVETVIFPEQKEFDILKVHFNQTKESLKKSSKESKTHEDIIQLQKTRENLNIMLSKMRGLLSKLKTQSNNNSPEAPHYKNLVALIEKEIRSCRSYAAKLNGTVNIKTIKVTGRDPRQQEQPYRTDDENPQLRR